MYFPAHETTDDVPNDAETDALAYYTSRLAVLAQDSRGRTGPALVIRSEDILSDPETVLARVAAFLHLATPIKQNYSTFPLTGVPGRGDFSDAIQEGRIRAPETDRARSVLRADVLDVAEHAYAHCLAALESLFD